ncbi:AAA family ATPase [Oxalobacteraceae bacterium]|nr:AAA family ATPase [Oxalobacteraceae bacterium]
MYTQFFSLKQSPFSIAPDPRYLYMSERHREALAHLLYGVGSGGGFVLLTGEIGAGKTTVCRCFIEQIPPNCKLAYIFNPKLSVQELLLSICEEFGIVPEPHEAGAASVKTYVDAINRYLLDSHAQSLNNVLIIDEAQNLSAEVLEQLRLLTNLETSERKLLQIILIGQPELRTILARPELEQLAQRVIARYHLGSLSEEETGSYIEHRLAVAGGTAIAPFPRSLMPLIHQMSKGVPRRINLLCDRALLGAYVENQHQLNRTIVRKAGEEVFAEQPAAGVPRTIPKFVYAAAGVLAGAVLSGAAAWQFLPHGQPGAAPTEQAGLPAGPADARRAGSGGSGKPLSGAAALVLPAQASTPQDGEAGLRQLALLWGPSLPPGDPCQVAPAYNLRCLQTKGSLADLQSLDRPALLRLRGAGDAPVYAMLLGLNGQAATLALGGQRQTVSLAALDARLDGEFTTFWRAPRGWRSEVVAGDKGPEVDWLAQRLAQWQGKPKPQGAQVLDAALQALLRSFQQSQQLRADGRAGPKTFIRLNQLAGVQEPLLRAAK